MTATQAPTLAGTFNHWQVDALATHAAAPAVFEASCWLDAGRQAFKWVFGGAWQQAWGVRGEGPLVPPLSGRAVLGGDDVVVNVLVAGAHRIRLDVDARRYTVERLDQAGLLDGALAPDTLLSGSFGTLLGRLREHAAHEPFGYAWHDWHRLDPALEAGSFGGALPLRERGRALFLFNARLHAPLHMVSNLNGWQVGPDRYTRVEGTDLHYLYRELPVDTVLRYKLVTDGEWFTDPYTRWVEPDGMPVPMFMTGRFQSVVDFAAPGYLRGDHLIALRFPSVVRGNTRDVWISLPRGYAHGGAEGYPVLYVNDGNEALTRVYLHRVAREMMDRGEVAPVIMVFVGLADALERNFEYSDRVGREAYAAFLAHELVPFIDGSLRTRRGPRFRGVTGVSYGAVSAYFTGWRHPNVFGCVAGQGTSFFVEDWDVLDAYVASPRPRLRLYLDSARPTWRGGPGDSTASARYAAHALRRSGHQVKHVVRRDQRHDWPYWAERFPEILRTFWPAR